MTPRIGIIIPAYKVEPFLARTLDSIRNQSFTNWHCIIVDDGSPDNAALIAAAYTNLDPRFVLIRQKNAGVSKARDFGFSKLPADITHVAFMDADDIYTPDALAQLLEATQNDPESIGAHGLADFIDPNDQPLDKGTFEKMCRDRVGYKDGRIVPWEDSWPTCFATLAFINTVFPPGVILAKKEVYQRAGNWDPTLLISQDWDMVVRIVRYGHLNYVPRVIVGYRRHPNNVSGNIRAFNKEAQAMYRKTFTSKENTPEQLEILKKGWRAWQLYRSSQKARILRQSIRGLQFRDIARTSAHLVVHAVRYARGYPSAKGW